MSQKHTIESFFKPPVAKKARFDPVEDLTESPGGELTDDAAKTQVSPEAAQRVEINKAVALAIKAQRQAERRVRFRDQGSAAA